MFKNLANLAGMMQQAQKLGGQMQALQQELRDRQVEGSAGGGMVKAVCNGQGELLSVSIDQQLVADSEKDLIEQLIPQAVSEAQAKGKALHQELMQQMTSELNLPGLDQAMSQINQP